MNPMPTYSVTYGNPAKQSTLTLDIQAQTEADAIAKTRKDALAAGLPAKPSRIRKISP